MQSLRESLLSHLAVYVCLFLTVVISIWAGRRRAKANKKAKTKHLAMVESGKTEAYALHPRIDLDKCSGCGTCTIVCPEGDILQMIDGAPVLVVPTKCVGHSLCYRNCPTDAITMVFGTERTGKEVPD